jgi:prolyl-tRNA editing enzyme YbaK/EbsC (Cys-tRNA(Pro) deacylase)
MLALSILQDRASRLNVTFYSARQPNLFPPGVCVKTLAVTFVPSRDVWLLVGLRLCDRLDFAKLAAALGVDQRNLKTMDRSAVFGATGWPPGAIGPFSLSAQTNVWLDEAIFRAPTIYGGSRELNEVLEISSVALLDIAEGQSRANGAQSFEQPH